MHAVAWRWRGNRSGRKNADVSNRWGTRISRGVQQLYFLRFPLLGWLLLPALCMIDGCTGGNTVTRGIMTMSRTWQAFYAAFFIASLANTVLICAKNIVRNGPERFAPPGAMKERPEQQKKGWLERTLNDSTPVTVSWVLAAGHIPTVLTLLYIGVTTYRERERRFYFAGLGHAYWHMWLGFACGLGAALTFWYGVSIFYLWVYPSWSEDPNPRTPASLLLPGRLPGMTQAEKAFKPLVAVWADWAVRPLALISPAGYAEDRDAPIWEYHTLSVVALGWFLALYLFLYPLTAPVVLSRRPVIPTLIAVVLAVLLGWGTRATKPQTRPEQADQRPMENPGRRLVLAMRIVIGITLLIFLTVLWYNALKNTVLMENAFPVLASVLVIAIFMQWFVSGASFFFDRYRVPVVTALLLLLFTSKWALQWVDQEHYFEARDAERVVNLDTPLEVMAQRMRRHPGEPYIIVTATGGGIQAAEWTAQVMAQMEKRFRDDPEMKARGYSMHDHLLLASGVSGGSVGLMPYLLEYTTRIDPTGKPQPMFQTVEYLKDTQNHDAKVPPDLLTRRLTLAPGCSSLEAIAWGLAYSDLERLLFTVPLLASVADQHVRDTASVPDRTWALSQSFDRNFADRDCGTEPSAQAIGEQFSSLPSIESGGVATLRSTADRLHAGIMPAFTFNTTVAETGGRFLLSNYQVPAAARRSCDGRCEAVIPETEFLPAESFLEAYGSESNCDLPQVKKDCYADISLATAARLSATFPIVSSATRIPQRYATRASHFVDGGYFDNDGTGSVTEFLLSAMKDNSNREGELKTSGQNGAKKSLAGKRADPPRAQAQPVSGDSSLLPKGPLNILLIEIRDGDDMDPTQNDDDLGHQTGKSLVKYAAQPTAWTSMNQLLAPLEGMWEAGHESITRRNRRELCLLTQLYAPVLKIHHMVVGIPSAPVEGKAGLTKAPPLNWKLTSAQREYIESWATAPDKPTQETITEAIGWIDGNLQRGSPQADIEPACKVYDQTYMRNDMR